MMEDLNLEEAVRETLVANENVVALFGGAGFALHEDQEPQAGQRILKLSCAAKELIGMATGMGVYGMHPVVHLDQSDLYSEAFLQLLNSSMQVRYRSGGQFSAPITLIVRYAEHLTAEPLVLQIPGLQVYAPSCQQDFSNMVEHLIRQNDPSLVFVPEKWPTLPDDLRALWEDEIQPKKARVLCHGKDLSIITYGVLSNLAYELAQELRENGPSVEVVDIRFLSPLDRETILASVRKTGRLVILHDSPRSFGFGAELAAFISETGIENLLAPVRRVCAFDVPDPGTLSSVEHPDRERLQAAIRELCDF